MARTSNRDRILTEGMRVVHQRGFAGASVRDIVHAAGVPQGSFTNHFASKEAFGLEVIDLYLAAGEPLLDATLRNLKLKPLERLAAYIDASIATQTQDDMRNGCLLGNFAAEVCDSSDAIRARLRDTFVRQKDGFADCLRDAVAAGQAPADLDCDETAAFILASLQGASLMAKTERSPAPLLRVKDMLFSRILKSAS